MCVLMSTSSISTMSSSMGSHLGSGVAGAGECHAAGDGGARAPATVPRSRLNLEAGRCGCVGGIESYSPLRSVVESRRPVSSGTSLVSSSGSESCVVSSPELGSGSEAPSSPSFARCRYSSTLSPRSRPSRRAGPWYSGRMSSLTHSATADSSPDMRFERSLSSLESSSSWFSR